MNVVTSKNPSLGGVAGGLAAVAGIGLMAWAITCFRRAADSMTYEDFRHCIHHEGTGAVRVSLGLASNLADVETFLRFAEDFLED